MRSFQPLLSGDKQAKTKILGFNRVWGNKVRVFIDDFKQPPSIAELGIYNERN